MWRGIWQLVPVHAHIKVGCCRAVPVGALLFVVGANSSILPRPSNALSDAWRQQPQVLSFQAWLNRWYRGISLAIARSWFSLGFSYVLYICWRRNCREGFAHDLWWMLLWVLQKQQEQHAGAIAVVGYADSLPSQWSLKAWNENKEGVAIVQEPFDRVVNC